MKDNIRKLDKLLLLFSIVLIISGLIMVFSSSNIAAVLKYNTASTYFFTRQIVFVLVGFILFLVIINLKLEWYNFFSIIYLFIIFILMIGLKFKGIMTNGASSWLPIFGTTLQPSEFSKPAMILFLACLLGARKKWKSAWAYMTPFAICGGLIVLVLTEPDLGTSIIMASIVLFIFYSVPIKDDNKLRWVKILGIVAMIALIIIVPNAKNIPLLTPSQKTRLDYKYPCLKKKNEGYQVCNGYIAMHNGGLTGAGLSKSKQKYLYLPESHTDFIFPIIVEELGVVGGTVLLILYILVLWRLYVIGKNAKDLRGSIIASGTFMYIFAHIVVNLGGLLALIPLTGVPLPFMSYGGSYMINLLILLSLCQRVAIESKTKVGKTK